MSSTRKIMLAVAAWVAVITTAHLATNVDWKVMLNDRLPEQERKLNVAYIPVT
jgi:NitT/TauT family transport system substrate-binding protein